MMPSDPSPSWVQVSLLAEPGTRYETASWLAHDGEPNGSVRYWPPSGYFTIQARPAALRELAAALVQAAGLADPSTIPAVEGVAG